MKTLKHLFGAAVLLADVLFGVAAPAAFKGLHAETPAHQHGTLAFYGVLALLTLCVIVSVARYASRAREAAKPAPRPSYFQPPRAGRR